MLKFLKVGDVSMNSSCREGRKKPPNPAPWKRAVSARRTTYHDACAPFRLQRLPLQKYITTEFLLGYAFNDRYFALPSKT